MSVDRRSVVPGTWVLSLAPTLQWRKCGLVLGLVAGLIWRGAVPQFPRPGKGDKLTRLLGLTDNYPPGERSACSTIPGGAARQAVCQTLRENAPRNPLDTPPPRAYSPLNHFVYNALVNIQERSWCW